MRYILLWVALISIEINAQELRIENPVTFLALGDSYTIGQSVSVEERWPNQLAKRLKELGLEAEVEIIATTGWTTGNLLSDLNSSPPNSENYSLVSLLIGVNNQFQARGIEEYETQFEELIQKAINYANGDKSHVFVLSIPDYAFTPFGESFSNVSAQIDLFNAANQQISANYGIPYINITDISRRGLEDPDLVANDGLHPSGKMYTQWVERILQRAQVIKIVTSTNDNQDLNRPNIYPNPANNFITVPVNSKTEITIYSIQGTLIQSIVENKTTQINLSNLNPGVYYILRKNGHSEICERLVKI